MLGDAEISLVQPGDVFKWESTLFMVNAVSDSYVYCHFLEFAKRHYIRFRRFPIIPVIDTAYIKVAEVLLRSVQEFDNQ